MSSPSLKPGERDRPILVTLVHGTFARNADWTKEGSLFRTQLEKHLPGARFETPSWSGWNFNSSRLRGAEKLADHIRRANPEGLPHFLIGHSHGGNVIRYALRDPEVSRRVSGIVTLATPFIRVDPRPFSPWLSFLVNANAVLGYALCLLAVVIVVFAGLIPLIGDAAVENIVTRLLQSGLGRWVLIGVVGAVFAVLRHLWLDPVRRLIEKLRRRLEIRQREIVRLLDPPTVANIPTLVCTARADEAGAALRFTRLSTEWFFFVLGEQVFTAALLFIAVPVAAAVGAIILLDESWLAAGAAVLAALLSVPLASSCYLIGVLLIPQTVRLIGLGVEGPLQTWLADFRTSALPEFWSGYEHHPVILPGRSSVVFGRLRHSLVYQVEDTAGFCAGWMRRASDQDTQPPPPIVSERPQPARLTWKSSAPGLPYRYYVSAGFFGGMVFQELATFLSFAVTGQTSDYSWLRTEDVPFDLPAAFYNAFVGGAWGFLVGRLEPVLPAKPVPYILALGILGAVCMTFTDVIAGMFFFGYPPSAWDFLSWSAIPWYWISSSWGFGTALLVLLCRRGLRKNPELMRTYLPWKGISLKDDS